MTKEINYNDLENKVLKNNQPVVVQVYTQACPNCKRLHPVFEETAGANSDRFTFFKIDAHKNIDFIKKYKVLSVPTLLFFRHGKLVDKKSGVISKKRILNRLEPLLNYSEEEVIRKEVKGYFKMPWK